MISDTAWFHRNNYDIMFETMISCSKLWYHMLVVISLHQPWYYKLVWYHRFTYDIITILWYHMLHMISYIAWYHRWHRNNHAIMSNTMISYVGSDIITCNDSAGVRAHFAQNASDASNARASSVDSSRATDDAENHSATVDAEPRRKGQEES